MSGDIVVIDGKTVRCPHCNEDNTIAEHDLSERYNRGFFTIDGGKIVAASWGQAPMEYTHVNYVCTACEREVRLGEDDDEIEERWD